MYSQDPKPTVAGLNEAGTFEDCEFDGKGDAVCVGKGWIGTSTFTATFSGSVVPVSTVVVDIPNFSTKTSTTATSGSTSGGSGSSSGNGKNGAQGGIVHLSWWTSVALLTTSLWLLM